MKNSTFQKFSFVSLVSWQRGLVYKTKTLIATFSLIVAFSLMVGCGKSPQPIPQTSGKLTTQTPEHPLAPSPEKLARARQLGAEWMGEQSVSSKWIGHKLGVRAPIHYRIAKNWAKPAFQNFEELVEADQHAFISKDRKGDTYLHIIDKASFQRVVQEGLKLGYHKPSKTLTTDPHQLEADIAVAKSQTNERPSSGLFPPMGQSGTTDSRTKMKNTNSYPFNVMGRIRNATGAQVGKRHVLTCGHCVDGWDGNSKWMPGYIDGAERLEPSTGRSSSGFTTVYSPFFGSKIYRNDYALVILQHKVNDAYVGYEYVNTVTAKQLTTYNKGYPLQTDQTCSPQYNPPNYTQRTMYTQPGVRPISHGFAALFNNYYTAMLTQHDTSGGHSGSPLYYYKNGAPNIIGLGKAPCDDYWGGWLASTVGMTGQNYCGWASSTFSCRANTANNAAWVRITPTVQSNVTYWKSLWPEFVNVGDITN